MTVRRRQELFLDAVEESALMVEVAYLRLHAAVVGHAFSDDDRSERETKLLTNELLSQAWLIIDAANRLRVSASAMAGLKRTPAVELMLRATAAVLPLRNYIQHLQEEAAAVAEGGHPLWGTFRYFVVHEVDGDEVSKFGVAWFIPGRIAVGPVAAPFKVGSVTHVTPPVDHITLAVGLDEVNLSAVAEAVAGFSRRLEAAVQTTAWSDDPDKRTLFVVPTDLP